MMLLHTLNRNRRFVAPARLLSNVCGFFRCLARAPRVSTVIGSAAARFRLFGATALVHISHRGIELRLDFSRRPRPTYCTHTANRKELESCIVSCLVTHAKRDEDIPEKKIRYYLTVHQMCYEKHAFYEFIIFRPSGLITYFKGSGTWWMRNCYFNLEEPGADTSPRPGGCQKMFQHPADLRRKSNPTRSKVQIYPITILEFPHTHKNRLAAERNGLCLKCFVRAAV